MFPLDRCTNESSSFFRLSGVPLLLSVLECSLQALVLLVSFVQCYGSRPLYVILLNERSLGVKRVWKFSCMTVFSSVYYPGSQVSASRNAREKRYVVVSSSEVVVHPLP